MRLLLDSNALIWAYSRPAELAAIARRHLGDPDNERLVSVASLWEISIKMSIGKLSFAEEFDRVLDDLAVTLLPVTVAHVEAIQTLPFHHRDPFDRMLVAQALAEGLTIVTRDRRFAAYDVPVLAA